MGTFVQAFAELGTGKKIMKILLIVALAVAAVVAEPEAEAEAAADAWYGYYGYPRYYGYYGYPKYKTEWVDGYGYAISHVGKRSAEADPGFAYTIGHPHVYGVRLVYAHPVAYANNVCKNEAGAVVPCASPVAVGSGVYNFADAPVGLHPVVPGVAPVAPAAAEADAVVSVEKREAEAEAEADPEAEAAADAWYAYYGRPAYYGYGYGLGGYYGGYAGYYGGYAGYGYYGLGHGYYGGVGCRNGYGAAVPCALGK